jgi:predicted TIM-barrel fold metal-dependent hydrolase
MRKDFEMTQEQLDGIMDACKPVRMIALQCGTPRSPQENANAAWERLGKELGFKHMTVKPNNKGDRYFTAETA